MSNGSGLRSAILAALLASGCASGSAAPAQAPGALHQFDVGDAAHGLTLAETICAACHAIGLGEAASPNPGATPFAVVANTPGMTSIALNAWLHTSHPTMPNLRINQDQTDDLWAYMLTLRERN